MPKLKTRKAAAKRFRVTGSGKKIMRRKAFKNHLLQHKSAERTRRRLSHMALVHESDEENVRLMLPYL
jgi:large subunit ribosomal protein L35